MNEDSDLRLCTPECGEWWPQSTSQQRVFNATNLTAGALGFILSLTVVILSCIYYKTTYVNSSCWAIYRFTQSWPSTPQNQPLPGINNIVLLPNYYTHHFVG